jgi:nucleotide-binding universal stress UspA family protein
MFKRILVPLDGSVRADRAISMAARVARAYQSSIMLLRVVEDVRPYGIYLPQYPISVRQEFEAEMMAEATSYLEGISQCSELLGVATETKALSGIAGSTILDVAQFQAIDLIVLCSRGRTGIKRWVLGSVAQEVVRHSPEPVLVLHEHGIMPPPSRAGSPFRALVALDGSLLSEAVLEPTARLVAALAAPAGGALHLFRVVGILSRSGQVYSEAYSATMMQEEARQEAQAYLEALVNRLREGELAKLPLTITSSVAVSSEVAGTIMRVAEQVKAEAGAGGYDLIAMATHGRGGLQRWAMGSITEQVLGASRLPLFIVRPHQRVAQAQPKGKGEGLVITHQ